MRRPSVADIQVPLEVFEYIDAGRNPQLYTKVSLRVITMFLIQEQLHIRISKTHLVRNQIIRKGYSRLYYKIVCSDWDENSLLCVKRRGSSEKHRYQKSFADNVTSSVDVFFCSRRYVSLQIIIPNKSKM